MSDFWPRSFYFTRICRLYPAFARMVGVVATTFVPRYPRVVSETRVEHLHNRRFTTLLSPLSQIVLAAIERVEVSMTTAETA